ncbi:hypothetical protein FHS95_002350 [Sphingomonas naasensis]|uniref:DUF2946 domain-containing protein n=1 Tax=Sphingomonas naasensis TaxID=1344951 RepID=A0A4S1W4W0_9SPHN|nr:DUF2946 family protein [Sphingomonas naasensis]NIJ20658.1 hypothetical protein [Sphingomonas naasensis]TGX37618.1 hypothetical protein E5A74_19925 [Sphingomonas naasensis]
MGGLRSWTKSNRALALWLIAMVLVVKAFVPQGYMIAPGKTLTLALCSGAGPAEMAINMPMAPAQPEPHSGKKAQDQICPFSVLGHAAANGVDAILLLAAIAFVLALGFAARSRPPLRRRAYLHPPLRGPPLLA